jgi:6-phosphogluconolactonase
MKHIYILSCEKQGGIYHYLFKNDKFIFVEKISLDRPMYAIIKDDKMYVILREIDTKTHFGGILSFDIAENGNLVNPTNIQSTNGIVPGHLEVIDGDRFVANYLSGNIVKFEENGIKTVTHTGNSIHPTRQEAPHTHFVCNTPDKEYVVCVDLGVDKIFVYTKELDKISEIKITDGYGPRHMVFSENGDYAFVACELSSTVEVLNYSNGKFEYINSLDCLPKDYVGESTVAAIRRKDNNVYISNRGHDSISVFDFENGSLKFKEHTMCCGKSPRDINIIGDYMFSTNELSDNVTIFKIRDNGTLMKIDNHIEVPYPVCIVSK